MDKDVRILITGNLGYVGPCLCQFLRKKYPAAYIAGYDLGYFQDCLTAAQPSAESLVDTQIYGDVRNFDKEILKEFDHVVHLAAISNDPIGKQFEQVTLDVNFKATVDIAKKAVEMGTKSFVFASSCSVYGEGGGEVKTEKSPVNPLTAYARSKVMAERAIEEMSRGNTLFTCLRFATACGMSDRLRLDLVLNDFVASALTTGKINILSDGTPWRPLINVNDMARAIDWALFRPREAGGEVLICNTGSNEWNFTVKDLAYNVQSEFPDVEVMINKSAAPDKRSYRVNFDLFSSYANGACPASDIKSTIVEMKAGLKNLNFHDKNFRGSNLMRLNVLDNLLEKKRLDQQLVWL